MAYVLDIAQQLSLELDLFNGEGITIPPIVQWLRNNIGMLNNALNISFAVNPTSLDLNDSNGNFLTDDQVTVFKSMFRVYYYQRKERYYLGAAGVGEAIQISSDGGTVKLISKLDVAKQFTQLKKDELEMLKNLINAYKRSNYSPQSIDSDDINSFNRIPVGPTYFNGLVPETA